ncbi:cadmium- manganese-transporting P-type ATPase [Paucilactobacillus suebicus DSM 5007 = KCTC 3549]|uniref:Cadmium-manganese-transporting P-type ATPase n=1 Tax=Paucilactobacillus suebicus DSM 5007 = KCTC 3549 TaxID=1423807 RepID=A0A0R1W7L3_9LACO|nr:cadmium- manganese-transporting P-type ATPase [Paucilactobacillus suebicus DSM 5007 = KCTC 3549]
MDQTIEQKITGLSQEEAATRLKANGPNAVAQPGFNFGREIVKRLWEPSAWILEAALILEIILGKYIQSIFIILMLLFAAINGAVQSRRAHRVLSGLSNRLTLSSHVKRSGKWERIDAVNLVVGDTINLVRGTIIPADVTIIAGSVSVNESSITGESNNVTHAQTTAAFAGTEVVAGDAIAKVTATGSQSRSGKTINLVNHASSPGHLQLLLSKIIGYLAILDSILAVILIITALIRHENIIAMAPFLAMLFIATIPIAMPSSFAVANSVEASVLSHADILVSDLSGIQDAANLDVLLIDKTGTITKNRPEVIKFVNLSSLTNQTVLNMTLSVTNIKSPSEVDAAIIDYVNGGGQAEHLPVNSFVAFDPSTGYSSAQIKQQNEINTVKLGSFKILSSLAKNAEVVNQSLLQSGRSVVVMLNDKIIGLFILQDQIRPDSQTAIQQLIGRGVNIIMLTGDNANTAKEVAQQVGLNNDTISFSNITSETDINNLSCIADVKPEDKLAIVNKFQHNGFTVGMTGDGINDTPALKQADVGIAVANAVDAAKQSAKNNPHGAWINTNY